jgi:hypothetical protein
MWRVRDHLSSVPPLGNQFFHKQNRRVLCIHYCPRPPGEKLRVTCKATPIHVRFRQCEVIRPFDQLLPRQETTQVHQVWRASGVNIERRMFYEQPGAGLPSLVRLVMGVPNSKNQREKTWVHMYENPTDQTCNVQCVRKTFVMFAKQLMGNTPTTTSSTISANAGPIATRKINANTDSFIGKWSDFDVMSQMNLQQFGWV